MPIAPQILTTGRSPGDMREFGILSPVLLAVVTGKTLWFFSRHFLIKFSENAGRYHFQCAQGISASNSAGWLALSSQGIKLKVTGDSVSLVHFPKRHFMAGLVEVPTTVGEGNHIEVSAESVASS